MAKSSTPLRIAFGDHVLCECAKELEEIGHTIHHISWYYDNDEKFDVLYDRDAFRVEVLDRKTFDLTSKSYRAKIRADNKVAKEAEKEAKRLAKEAKYG